MPLESGFIVIKRFSLAFMLSGSFMLTKAETMLIDIMPASIKTTIKLTCLDFIFYALAEEFFAF